MKNNKKVILMLGLALSIICGGVFNNAWAMEKQCTISQEIKELHKQISKEFILLSSPISSSWSSGVVGKDFLKMEPLDMLDHLRCLIIMLNSSLKQIRRMGGTHQAPGAMSLRHMKMYEQDLSVLEKAQKLFDLIKSSCGITDNEIKESSPFL